MLRPVETPTREIKKLDGLWAFSLDRENCGIDQRWWESHVPYNYRSRKSCAGQF